MTICVNKTGDEDKDVKETRRKGKSEFKKEETEKTVAEKDKNEEEKQEDHKDIKRLVEEIETY